MSQIFYVGLNLPYSRQLDGSRTKFTNNSPLFSEDRINRFLLTPVFAG